MLFTWQQFTCIVLRSYSLPANVWVVLSERRNIPRGLDTTAFLYGRGGQKVLVEEPREHKADDGPEWLREGPK